MRKRRRVSLTQGMINGTLGKQSIIIWGHILESVGVNGRCVLVVRTEKKRNDFRIWLVAIIFFRG